MRLIGILIYTAIIAVLSLWLMQGGLMAIARTITF